MGLAGFALVLIAAAGIATAIFVRRAEPFLRARIIQELHDRFHARVELDSFHVSLARGLRAEGHGLRIWPPALVEGVTVAPVEDNSDPLIRLADFSFQAPFHYEPGKPFHISVVMLNGLDIHLPPKSHFGQSSGAKAADAAQVEGLGRMISFGLDRIECTSAHFVLETSKPGKMPLDFAISHFTLTDSAGGGIHSGSAMRFDADLTNPRPVGIIHSSGTIGPWQTTDPGESPISGGYTFDHADLASFKGIGGILSSTGKYQGTLRDLIVDGDADTPDFRLAHFGNTLPLKTHFHAKVDATNGDTWLEPVDATLGRSHFTAQGQVVRVVSTDPTTPGGLPAIKGHDIDLNVHIDNGRIEDFLRLASRSPKPLLTGALQMNAHLHIPPGQEPVHQRINLKGSFNLDQARFTSEKIQDDITQLSLRGLGKPKEIKGADATATRSIMQGGFTMINGVITLPALTYAVPGATIQLAGTYGVDGGAIDFAGTAKLQATISQMVGGVLGALLKPANKLFEKDGSGTAIPIHISGTREDPKFGIDFNRMKKGSKEPAAGKP